VSSEPISVLVLYVHPLLGEGLARLLNAESGLAVDAVEIRAVADVDRALAREPGVLILEEGGAVGLEQLLARTRCSILVEVSLDTGEAWILRREALRTRPDDLVAAIVDACLVQAAPTRPRSPRHRPARRQALGAAPVRA
jgi:hypothetical protein